MEIGRDKLKYIDPVDAKEELQNILSGQEYRIYYQEDSANILQRWIERFGKWLNEILQNLFPNANITEKTAEWIIYGLTIIGFLFSIFLFFKLWKGFVRERRYYSKPIGTAEDLALSSSLHLQEADRLTEKGEYRLSLRHIFLAFILYLDQHHWIDARPWKTNWEYYEELQERHSVLTEPFHQLAIKFEEVVYGGRPIQLDDFLVFRKQVDEWMNIGGRTWLET